MSECNIDDCFRLIEKDCCCFAIRNMEQAQEYLEFFDSAKCPGICIDNRYIGDRDYQRIDVCRGIELIEQAYEDMTNDDDDVDHWQWNLLTNTYNEIQEIKAKIVSLNALLTKQDKAGHHLYLLMKDFVFSSLLLPATVNEHQKLYVSLYDHTLSAENEVSVLYDKLVSAKNYHLQNQEHYIKELGGRSWTH